MAATLIFKRSKTERDLMVLNGGQLLAAGIVLIVPSLIWEPVADLRLTAGFLGAWLYLITGVSWLGMGTWFWLLRHGDATRASAYSCVSSYPSKGDFSRMAPSARIFCSFTAGIVRGAMMVHRTPCSRDA